MILPFVGDSAFVSDVDSLNGLTRRVTHYRDFTLTWVRHTAAVEKMNLYFFH